LLIASAAVLWSLSGAFAKVLTQDTFLGLNHPPVAPLLIAFYRPLFAGAALVPTLRPRDISFQPMMVPMMICFAAMNAMFVAALTGGTAANAILLQYTAPMWMYLAGVWWLGEPADRRGAIALLIGLAGVAVIIAGGWQDAQLSVVAVALGSGVTYAAVVLCLRVLRDQSSRWLTVINHLFAALVLVPFIAHVAQPTPLQLGVLFVFGTLQMALPYWLMALGLRSVSAHEAGMITLLEPLLNPWWAYVVASEVPSRWSFIGGAFILGALVWRYAPRREAGHVNIEKGNDAR
jgi:drug/metabolite transporter (DMT)-like permease